MCKPASCLPACVCLLLDWLQEITNLVRQSAAPSNNSSPVAAAQLAARACSPEEEEGLCSDPGSCDSGSEVEAEVEGESRQVAELQWFRQQLHTAELSWEYEV